MKSGVSRACCGLMLLQLAACHENHGAAGSASSENETAPSAAGASGASASSNILPMPTGGARFAAASSDAIEPAAAESTPPTAADAATFVPLRSAQVKDAIYRAMTTAKTQRWKDGELSGYAVPSQALGVYGCRAVSYTVDQLPHAAPRVINACR